MVDRAFLLTWLLFACRLDLHRDPQDGQTPIGHHEKEVKCVEYSQRIGAAVTGGWDGAVHLW